MMERLCPRKWLSMASPNRCGMDQVDGAESDLGHYTVYTVFNPFPWPVEIAHCRRPTPNQAAQLKAL